MMEPVKPAKSLPECAEGPEAFERFDATVTKLLSVPKATLLEREVEYGKAVEANPNRRGPKHKVKAESKSGKKSQVSREKVAEFVEQVAQKLTAARSERLPEPATQPEPRCE